MHCISPLSPLTGSLVLHVGEAVFPTMKTTDVKLWWFPSDIVVVRK